MNSGSATFRLRRMKTTANVHLTLIINTLVYMRALCRERAGAQIKLAARVSVHRDVFSFSNAQTTCTETCRPFPAVQTRPILRIPSLTSLECVLITFHPYVGTFIHVNAVTGPTVADRYRLCTSIISPPTGTCIVSALPFSGTRAEKFSPAGRNCRQSLLVGSQSAT